MRLLTLLTDFGEDDPYVAVIKGVILRLAPGATLVDLGHGVAPGDVEGAAFLLGTAALWFPPQTIHLAVVDPGVGSRRRILVARRGDATFVAPDNGLLTPVLAGAEVRSVEREDLFLPGPGSTFHGRDRFAPIAAYLLRNEAREALGPSVPDPVRLDLPPPRRDGRLLAGRVRHVDRFGNLVTDIPNEWLGGAAFAAEVTGHRTTRYATHYRELPAGEPGVLPGSFGTLELALDGESLAQRWGVARGAPVRIALDAP